MESGGGSGCCSSQSGCARNGFTAAPSSGTPPSARGAAGACAPHAARPPHTALPRLPVLLASKEQGMAVQPRP